MTSIRDLLDGKGDPELVAELEGETHVHQWEGPFKVGSQEWNRRCACGAVAPTHPTDSNWGAS